MSETKESAAPKIRPERYLDLWEQSVSLRFTVGPLFAAEPSPPPKP